MEKITVSSFRVFFNKWARTGYLWDSSRNKYLQENNIELQSDVNLPCDVLLVPNTHYPNREALSRVNTSNMNAEYRGLMDYTSVPVICDSSSDFGFLTPNVFSTLSLPNVRYYMHGVSFRDPIVHRRRYLNEEYYNHVYRQRDVYNISPDERLSRPEIPTEIQEKIVPLIRPPMEPFSDDVFKYIAQKIKPLKDRSLDISFAGRVSYHFRRHLSVPTEQRRRLKNMWNSLPGKNKLFFCYDDPSGTRYNGKQIKNFSFPYEYVDLLLDTKIVISPWGFSAWCIRDFEALACGCILVKPECSNMLTYPDIYNPANNLLIWCDIKFDRLAEQLNYCYKNLDKMQERADRGRQFILDAFYPNDKLFSNWTKHIRKLLENCLETKSYTAAENMFFTT
jgi:hypothetical protein